MNENELTNLTDEQLQQAFSNASLNYFMHQDMCWQLMREIVARAEKPKQPLPTLHRTVQPPAQPLNATTTLFQGTVKPA